jgi:hypothetical protein
VSKIIKKHFFIGDGDFGQEIFLWRNFYNTINFSGFIDINKINNINLSREKSDYTITIGDPIISDEIYRNFKKKKFYNKSIIFNNAVISKKVLIGAGSIIMSNAVISNNVKIGKTVWVFGGLFLSNKGSSTGSTVKITGLPFAVSSSGETGNFSMAAGNVENITYSGTLALWGGSGGNPRFVSIASNSVPTQLSDTAFSNTSSIILNFCYQTSN